MVYCKKIIFLFFVFVFVFSSFVFAYDGATSDADNYVYDVQNTLASIFMFQLDRLISSNNSLAIDCINDMKNTKDLAIYFYTGSPNSTYDMGFDSLASAIHHDNRIHCFIYNTVDLSRLQADVLSLSYYGSFNMFGLNSNVVLYNRVNEYSKSYFTNQYYELAVGNDVSQVYIPSALFGYTPPIVFEYFNALKSDNQSELEHIREELKNINDSITDDTIPQNSDLVLPSDDVQDITSGSFNSIFNNMRDTLTGDSENELVVEIPFTGKSFIISSKGFYPHLGIIGVLINSFWWFILGLFITKDLGKIINKIKQGDIENAVTHNVKEDLLWLMLL